MKRFLLLVGVGVVVVAGCAMFRSWKSIPPPGGCDQCHRVPISYDWVLVYQPATLNDETGKLSWQQPESLQKEEPASERLEQQKISEQRCFRCHKGPNEAHSGLTGRYHH